MSASIHVSTRSPRGRAARGFARTRRAAQITVRFALVLASLGGTFALGLYTQIYEGAFDRWVARDLSGAFYALAWCLALATLRPTARPRSVGAVALAICFAIEISQLWHPHVLEVARATQLGRLALGSTFMWSDLPYYAAGATIGWAWLAWLPFRTSKHDVHAPDFVRPMGVQR